MPNPNRTAQLSALRSESVGRRLKAMDRGIMESGKSGEVAMMP